MTAAEVRPLVAADAARGLRDSDMGNSERLVDAHRDRIRYCHAEGRWYLWDGQRWQADHADRIMDRADDVVRHLHVEASRLDGRDDRQRMSRHALASESLNRRTAMVIGAQHLVPVHPNDLDAHPYLLNVANGVLDLRTATLLPHDPTLLLTHLVDVPYDHAATCPLWLSFLDRVMDGSGDLIAYIQRVVGYCLTGSTSEHAMFVLHGTGRNGKGTLLYVVQQLLDGLARVADASLLLTTKVESSSAPSPALAVLSGVRAAVVDEVNEGNRLNAAMVKRITGGGRVTARHLRRDYFEYDPQFKVLLAVNHRPEISDTSEGMWSRLHTIPFAVTIPEGERDRHLQEKLLAEMPGILAWAVQGCLQWQAQGLTPPEAVCAAGKAYRADSDPIGQFLGEWCDTDSDSTAYTISKGDLHAAYLRWCNENTTEPVTGKRFTNLLRDKGFQDGRNAAARLWFGIRLKGRDT